MSKKAVDIVLLPDESITARVIEANAGLIEKYGRKIVLDRKNTLPHISLAMGCLDKRDIEKAGNILESTAEKYPPGKLRIIGTFVSVNSIGEKVSSLVIEKTKQLQRLHEAIMAELEPVLSPDADEQMIYPSGPVAETTLAWIRNYRDRSSFENFQPHITLGYGVADILTSPLEFKPSKLALCHLGNHCTCREVLRSITFQD